MAQFLITAPDGTKYQVTGPEGATEQEALAQVQAQHAPPAQTPANPATDFGGDTLRFGPLDTHIPIGQDVQNYLAGAGKALADLGRGATQWGAGIADSLAPRQQTLSGLITGEPLSRVDEMRQQVAESRRLDAPLIATTAGKVGNISGNVAATVPALAIPGANTVAGAATIGAITGALQPSTSTGETVSNIGIGGALGAGGQAVGKAVAAGAQKIIASRAATATATETQNAVRDATLKASQETGYVVPPTVTNPSLTNTALESASGRYATKQAAMVKNQTVTNRLVADEIGAPKGQPITQQTLQNIRSQAGQTYRQVKQTGLVQTDSQYLNDLASITNASDEVAKGFPGATTPAADKIDTLINSLSQDNFSAAQAVEYSKRLRQQASANYKLAGRSANPEDLALAQAQSKGADALEEMIGRHLNAQGKPDLLGAYQEARKKIAQSYNVDAALNDATGNIDAKVLARQLDNGRPLSGGLKAAARFGQAFGEVAGEPVKGPGVSKLAFASAAGGALLGQPQLLALPAASWAARKTLLAGPANRYLAAPNYAPSLLGTAALKGLQQSPQAVLPATAATLPLIQPGQ